jgi:hypothetical protein
MRMGIGLGIGINRSNYAQGIFSAYQSRVIADGGVTEAGQCVDAVSSLLQSASLLLIPSGYKGGKAYAEIPTNGNGDLTWTRASDAWRTNADGLIQRVPWNLLTYSEQFDNGAWIKNNATITSNAINAPNGTLTADKLIETTANGVHNAIFVLTPNVTTYTASFYAKAAERNFVYYSFGGPSWGGQGFMVNLTTGAVSQNTTGATPTVTLLPDGWVKIEASRAAVSTTQIQFQIFTGLDSTTFSYTGDSTKGIFIWGAQLVEGTTAQTYLPTTDRLNFPRLSYMYGSCPALLLEPQRTNLLLNSGWVGGGSVPTSWTSFLTGSTTAVTSIKNLSVTAYRFVGTSQRAMFIQTIAVTNAISYASSIYVESVTTSTQISQMLLVNGSGTSTYYRNNVLVNANDTIVAGFTYTLIFVASSTANADFRFGLGCNSNTTADYILSMPQVEVGAYPTTFILTPSGASATRVADSFSRNNIFTNGLITSSGGTWFVELRGNVSYTRDGGSTSLAISTTSADVFAGSTGIEILANTGLNRLSVIKRISGTATTLYLTTTDTVKIAVKWNGTNADVFVNGTKQVSATSFTTTNMEFLKAFGADVPKFIQAMALYPTPLSDTDCTTLTTL